MYQIETDEVRNLLVLRFSGQVGVPEAQQCWAAMPAALGKVQPGFQLLTDLAGLEAMEFACAPFIQKVMELFRERGVALVVRVVPDPKKDIGFKIMSYFHYGPQVRFITCETLAEAMAALD